jgi:sulfite reductase (ferredoxin)
MFYTLPANLAKEIDGLEALIDKYRRGDLDAASLKAHRVPFGCYEQRSDGTYMLRIRSTGGAVTPRQLRAMALLSRQYGADFVHITTRQEFQIHDVALENVVPAMCGLLAAGLSTRGGGGNTIRNILISPDSGVTSDEVFDPSRYAFALTTLLIAEPDSWNLPRKLKIAFSNSSSDTAFAQFNDIGFIAALESGVKGFKVYVAGGLGAKSAVGHLLHEFIRAGDVYLVARAVKRLFDRHGNRKNRNSARLRFLWEQLGEAEFRRIYHAEFEAAAADPQLPRLFPDAPASKPQTPAGAVAADESVEFHLWKKRYCTEQKQRGFYSVLIPAVLGNIKNNDVKVLAEFLESFGDDSVRATFGQNLRLRNIAEAALGSMYTTVKGISELADAPRVFAHSNSCTGADTCKLGICLPKGALSAVNAKLSSSSLDLDKLASFQINFSGCPNTCGQHMIADLGFYGQALRKGQQIYPAYGIVAGAIRDDGNARLAQPIDNISAHDLPEFTAELLAIWLEKQWRFNSFAEYIDAEGKDDIRDICNRYRDVPDFDVDKSYYFDWGAQKPLTLAGRGLGECAAGLFDLIGVDRKFIEEQRKQLTRDIPAPVRADALYRIVLGSARMLLVTRGVEARTDTAVFLSFEQHFISAGLVDEAHRPIVVAARVRDLPALLNNQGAVLALANAVRELYDNMDHTLRFPAEIARSAAASA